MSMHIICGNTQDLAGIHKQKNKNKVLGITLQHNTHMLKKMVTVLNLAHV